jgi:hypothetical protein
VESFKMAQPSCEGNKNIRYQLLVNQDPESSIVTLLNKANVSIWMSSRLNPDFYNREKVKEAFIGAANRTKLFHLILDTGANLDQRKKELPWLNELIEKGKIAVKQSSKPIRHGLLVDSNHLRMEKEHGQDINKILCMVIWNTKNDEEFKTIMTTVQSRFDSWWINIYPINFIDAKKINLEKNLQKMQALKT